MQENQAPKTPSSSAKNWRSTSYANLIRYVPSKKYYARIRVGGKLIVKSLKTHVLSVAVLRLGDLQKEQRQRLESASAAASGKMTVANAIEIHRKRIAGDVSLKPRTKDYHEQRIKALLKSWPNLENKEIRSLTKSDCLDWAANFGANASSTAFNHTVGILRGLLEIGVEAGARYDNPAKSVKRARERQKRAKLPEAGQFESFVTEIQNGGGGFSRHCADLVRFLAFGGFRKGEAANITWADCDFDKGEILVRGDAETGTKNWTSRRVPMIPEMRALLERLHEARGEGNPDAAVMLVRECQKAMDRAATKIGMQRITHHSLRHLFATRCIESGVDIPTVARWLGHKDGGALAMKTYGHLRDQHSTAMAQKVTFAQSTAKTSCQPTGNPVLN